MDTARARWPQLRVALFDRPVGPHVMPMLEIDIPVQSNLIGEVLPWIMVNHGQHSVLLHPHTGNSYRDHTEYPAWIGQKVPLNLARL